MNDSATLTLRSAQAADASLLTDLGRRTFTQAFAAQNTAENLQFYLDSAFTVTKMGEELATPNSFFTVAESEGKPLGYCKTMLNYPHPQLPAQRPLHLHRLYVLENQLGRGVGQLLMEHVLQQAAQAGCDAVWLGVWEHNPRALAFYRKWQFVPFGSYLFPFGDEAQTDLLLWRPLEPSL